MAKVMSYEEFKDYARKYYERGGDSYVECWDERDFDEYVESHGSMTKRKALGMFKFERDMQKERAGWY